MYFSKQYFLWIWRCQYVGTEIKIASVSPNHPLFSYRGLTLPADGKKTTHEDTPGCVGRWPLASNVKLTSPAGHVTPWRSRCSVCGGSAPSCVTCALSPLLLARHPGQGWGSVFIVTAISGKVIVSDNGEQRRRIWLLIQRYAGRKVRGGVVLFGADVYRWGKSGYT